MVDEIIEAEIVGDFTEPIEIQEPWAKRRKRKKPRGTRMKDFPEFTTKVKEKILNAARLGMPVDFSAYFAGVHPNKLLNWLKFGAEAKEKAESGLKLNRIEKAFVDFDTEYQTAVVTPVAVLLADAFRAARADGPTAIKLLEKIAPTQFGPKPTSTINVGVSVQQGLTDGTNEVHKKISTGDLRKLRAYTQNQIIAGDEVEEENDSEKVSE